MCLAAGLVMRQDCLTTQTARAVDPSGLGLMYHVYRLRVDNIEAVADGVGCVFHGWVLLQTCQDFCPGLS